MKIIKIYENIKDWWYRSIKKSPKNGALFQRYGDTNYVQVKKVYRVGKIKKILFYDPLSGDVVLDSPIFYDHFCLISPQGIKYEEILEGDIYESLGNGTYENEYDAIISSVSLDNEVIEYFKVPRSKNPGKDEISSPELRTDRIDRFILLWKKRD